MKAYYLASLAFSVVLLSSAGAAHADRIVIPIFQSQVGVNNGTQNQAGGGASNQSAALGQSNQQSQTVNVVVPSNFQGNVRTVYSNGGGGNGYGGQGNGGWQRGGGEREHGGGRHGDGE